MVHETRKLAAEYPFYRFVPVLVEQIYVSLILFRARVTGRRILTRNILFTRIPYEAEVMS